MNGTRDKFVDVMWFWGILFVVMGHGCQFPYFFFPAYFFHMGFFFFISGYLFRVRNGVCNKLEFVRKKILSQLLPYFVFNAGFFCLAYILRLQSINISLDLTLHNFFIEPFFSGNQNYLSVPLWFLLSLFIVNIIMQIFYINESKKNIWIISIFVLIFSLFSAYKGLNHLQGIKLMVVRTGLCLLFFQTGILVKAYKEYVDKIILSPVVTFILWILVIAIMNNFGNIDYAILTGNVANKIFYIPLITTTLIILISYSICYHLNNAIKEKSLIVKIGQNSFWIMSFHLLIFFILNFIFYKLGYINRENLSTQYFTYDIGHNFYIYLFSGLVFPVIIGSIFKKSKNYLINKYING